MHKNHHELLDCVIIGAGPAGLTAAIYLKRFRRNILILDNQQSRTSLIPKTHNYPGFPEGISGNDLLANLRKQLAHYDTQVQIDTAEKIQKKRFGFEINCHELKLRTKKIIIATGVLDNEPFLPNLKNAIQRGLIRHCPVCDGYEVINQTIGVIGYGNKGVKGAFSLQCYSPKITLITLGENLNYSEKRRLRLAEIALITDPIFKVIIKNNKLVALVTIKGEMFTFDTIYSALGAEVRTELAIKLGARHRQHFLIVNHNQETSIANLYAIGDIVQGLNQICVATGQAAIAATHIHNKL